MAHSPLNRMTPHAVRALSITDDEFAFLDVRGEGAFSRAHPLQAVSLPLSELELHIARLVPRLSAPVLLFDGGQGLSETAAGRLHDMGYSAVTVVTGGLAEWRDAGGELFRDVNVPSKAFGEWVEHVAGTPSLSAVEVKALLDSGADAALLDVRPFNEYAVMTLPGSVNVPGADLLLRAKELVPSDDTLVIVHCAGRTRSIIAAQTLVDSGLFPRAAALRNGTIGWVTAGFDLEYGASRRAPLTVRPENLRRAQEAARGMAERCGVRLIDDTELQTWEREAQRKTLFRFDVRSPEEYAAERADGFSSAPGGQLVQAADEYMGVWGARIVLADDDGVRALVTASRLRQMGRQHAVVLRGGLRKRLRPAVEQTETPFRRSDCPAGLLVTPEETAILTAEKAAVVLDLARSPKYAAGHVPGAYLCPRALLLEALPSLPASARIILTSPDGILAAVAAPELSVRARRPVSALDGGTSAWQAEHRPLETGPTHPLVPVDDCYKRPYEGTDNSREAMQSYIEWELGLVEQMRRDGTARFNLRPAPVAPFS
jgi:rhodanese-related sulfurtransferase